MVAGCDTSHAGCGGADGMDAPPGREGYDGCEGYGGCEGYPFPGIAPIALVPISAISLPSGPPGRDPLGDPLGDPFGEMAGAAAVGMSATPGDWGEGGASFDAAKAAIHSGA